ncbi:MAG TPA: hypothetical protein VHE09_00580, partial [Rhizomicrobium sp.]|nr:hypothetical protein [Rhizomicrobium sp.]
MHEFRVWVLAALVLLGTTETEAAAKKIAPAKKPPAPVEYDFRGARLGMSLQDFRNLPFPDLDKRSARAICTSDSESVGHGVVL